MTLQTAIETYKPYNEQEVLDQKRILTYLAENNNLLTRENEEAHFTASAWIVNPDFTKVAMVFHHIYQSWSWTGGHADGDADLLRVALKEANEELGLEKITPVMPDIFSLEVLSVPEHEKKGKTVREHLHLNATYLLQAEEESLVVNPEENSAVAWLTLDEAIRKSNEEKMRVIYKKLNDKIRSL